MTPIYAGGGIGTALFSATGVSIPTILIYNVHVGYRKNLAPLTSVFIQGGYEVINMSITAPSSVVPYL